MAIGVVLGSFTRAVGQLTDARFRRVFFIGIGLSLALLIAAVAGFTWLLDWITPEQIWLPVLGDVQWLNDLVSWGGAFLLAFLSIFLMVPVASAITSMFLDDVADAVEAEHYPHLPKASRQSFGDALRDTLNFLGVLVVANMLALVLIVILSPAAPLIFWAVNGFLLGREYYTMAAVRRMSRKDAIALRRRHISVIWLAGILMAVPLSIPLINLLIPILGAATFTHLYHRLSGTPLPVRGATNAQYRQR